jgi:hypothetical protein
LWDRASFARGAVPNAADRAAQRGAAQGALGRRRSHRARRGALAKHAPAFGWAPGHQGAFKASGIAPGREASRALTAAPHEQPPTHHHIPAPRIPPLAGRTARARAMALRRRLLQLALTQPWRAGAAGAPPGAMALLAAPSRWARGHGCGPAASRRTRLTAAAPHLAQLDPHGRPAGESRLGRRRRDSGRAGPARRRRRQLRRRQQGGASWARVPAAAGPERARSLGTCQTAGAGCCRRRGRPRRSSRRRTCTPAPPPPPACPARSCCTSTRCAPTAARSRPSWTTTRCGDPPARWPPGLRRPAGLSSARPAAPAPGRPRSQLPPAARARPPRRSPTAWWRSTR